MKTKVIVESVHIKRHPFGSIALRIVFSCAKGVFNYTETYPHSAALAGSYLIRILSELMALCDVEDFSALRGSTLYREGEVYPIQLYNEAGDRLILNPPYRLERKGEYEQH